VDFTGAKNLPYGINSNSNEHDSDQENS
jgi:hypothetical protein